MLTMIANRLATIRNGGVWTPPANLAYWLSYAKSGTVGTGGTWPDYSGNGLDATLNGDATVTSTGLNCDGAGDYSLTSHNSILDVGTGDFTICAWVKSTNADNNVIYSKNASPDFFVFSINSDGTVRMLLDDGSAGNWEAVSTATVLDGSWHFVAAVCDRDTSMTIYTDATTAVNTSVTHTGDCSSTGNVRVGRRVDLTTWDMIGNIDGVMLFKRALSSSEMTSIRTQSPDAR